MRGYMMPTQPVARYYLMIFFWLMREYTLYIFEQYRMAWNTMETEGSLNTVPPRLAVDDLLQQFSRRWIQTNSTFTYAQHIEVDLHC